MSEKQTMFSVIIPVYNVEDYLSECLDSVLCQNFHNYEILVVEDKSTDSSLQIARRYAQAHMDRIRLLEHQVNKGLGGARNTGIDEAKGQYLVFLDSDDYMKPGALEQLYSVLVRENIDVVEFGYDLVDEGGAFLRRVHCGQSIYAPTGRERSLITRSVTAWNKVVRRSVYVDNRIYFPEKRYYEDYCTIPKFWMLDIKAVTLDESLYGYRQRAGSIMHDTNISKTQDILLGTDELLRFAKEQNLSDSKLQELERLAIEHVLLNATLRVNSINWHTDMQKKLKAYMRKHFPNYMNNPYMNTFSNREKRLLKLIEGEYYGAVYVMWHQRNRVSGAAKRVLRQIKLIK